MASPIRYIQITFSLLVVLFITLAVCSMSSASCYESTIVSPSPFMGNSEEIFKLSDGSVWEVKYEYQYLYSYYPSVVVCPSKAKLMIGDKSLNIALISKTANQSSSQQDKQAIQSRSPEFVETRVNGQFEGWSGDTIVKTIDGHIWQQVEPYIWYHYALNPKVIIIRTKNVIKMQVEGVEKLLHVVQLK